MGKTKGKRRKETVASAKKKLWRVFSEFIRLRDSDIKGYCKCITCDRVLYWKGKGMQAGHFIPQKGSPAILFHEKNVHAQCNKCNGFLQGQQYIYGKELEKRYGKAEVNKLVMLAGTKFVFTIPYLKELLFKYTQKRKELIDDKKGITV